MEDCGMFSRCLHSCNGLFTSKRIAGPRGAYDIGKYSGRSQDILSESPENKKDTRFLFCLNAYDQNTGGKELKQIRKGKTAAWAVRFFSLTLAVVLSGLITGCVKQTDTSEKLRDLKFTVLDKEAVPSELSQAIDGEKEDPFKLSYADQGVLYIAQGYGGQPTSGYSVEVNELYETKDAVCIHTTLMGPEKGEETKETVTYPYVVVQLEYIGKDVVFN